MWQQKGNAGAMSKVGVIKRLLLVVGFWKELHGHRQWRESKDKR